VISTIGPGSVHGSCVDFDGKSISAIGPSGSGKSTLALNLIALGGVLVSDDQVILSTDIKGVNVSPPASIAGKIEARNVGILNCPYLEKSRLNLVVDLNAVERDRLPIPRTVKVGEHRVEIIAGNGIANLPTVVRLLNLFGRDQETGSMP